MAVSNLIYNAYRDYSSKRSALLMDPVFQGEDVPKGKREAILLIPGFTAGDWTFSTMSPWLQQIGYRTYLSGININVGCPQRKVERMLGRLEEISKDEGGRIVIIGHSLGGLVACALARQRPDLVQSCDRDWFAAAQWMAGRQPRGAAGAVRDSFIFPKVHRDTPGLRNGTMYVQLF